MQKQKLSKDAYFAISTYVLLIVIVMSFTVLWIFQARFVRMSHILQETTDRVKKAEVEHIRLREELNKLTKSSKEK
jgi:hypothetical protein